MSEHGHAAWSAHTATAVILTASHTHTHRERERHAGTHPDRQTHTHRHMETQPTQVPQSQQSCGGRPCQGTACSCMWCTDLSGNMCRTAGFCVHRPSAVPKPCLQLLQTARLACWSLAHRAPSSLHPSNTCSKGRCVRVCLCVCVRVRVSVCMCVSACVAQGQNKGCIIRARLTLQVDVINTNAIIDNGLVTPRHTRKARAG